MKSIWSMVNKAARGPDLTYVTFGPIKILEEVCLRLSSVYGWTFLTAWLEGVPKRLPQSSVEIASDLMPMMKVVPKMPHLLTVASSMYVGRVSPVILYFRGYVRLDRRKKGRKTQNHHVPQYRILWSSIAEVDTGASTWFLNEILSNNVSNLL